MNHVQAKPVVEAAWRQVWGRDPTPLEALYAQAIASLETGYGQSGQFQKYAEQGQYNWGGIQSASKLQNGNECPPGWVYGVDQHPTCFRAFPTQEEAAAYFIHTLTKGRWPGVVDAMTGSPEDVARAMRTPAPPYYTGIDGTEDQKVAFYAGLIQKNIDAIAQNLPIPSVPGAPSGGGGGGSTFIRLVALGGLGYLAYQQGWLDGAIDALGSLRRRL